jgi:1-deoxy-D-xylulose-5-phosphate reductoisomerase
MESGQDLNSCGEIQISGARKRVSILGSTGIIGQHTCDLVASHPERLEVVALAAHRNAAKLAEQAVVLGAKFAALADARLEGELRRLLDGTGIECAAGAEALVEAASLPCDWIMASIVGAAGLAPTLAALRQGGILALANKECLVSAGALFMAEAAKHGATLIPVDSEHSAVFQSLDSPGCDHVDRIVLTASGGPFRSWTLAQIAAAKPEDALKHPNWSMGQKITIDSATLMNKGLELIEAYHLFNVKPEQLSAIIHPQSIVHCLVYYCDGSVIAQASLPDMRTPIAYSLAWPERLRTNFPRLDLTVAGRLTFEPPDETRFPSLRLAREALKEGGIAPTVLNAANEVAVQAFLDREIPFLGIPAVVEATLDASRQKLGRLLPDSLEAVLHADEQARVLARAEVKSAAAPAKAAVASYNKMRISSA